MNRLVAVLATTVVVAACGLDSDFAESLVEKQAERNERQLIEQQRAELPLPDPDVVAYISYTTEELALDDAFTVDLVDDLVVGAGRTEPEYLFVSFSGRSSALGNVAVDAEGRLFVLETRSDEVRVFDPDGEFLFKFGQPGEGPGDFQGPYGMVVVGGEVHVFHRFYFSTIWTVDGDFVRDRETLRTPEAEEATRVMESARDAGAAPSRAEAERRANARRFRTPLQVAGRPDGTMTMVFRAEPGERPGRIVTPYVRVVGTFEDGVEDRRVIAVPEWSNPSLAIGPGGGMYLAMFGHLGTERYILALDPEGEPRFVIVTPWDPEMPPRSDLRVDGQGRLYAFPNFQAPVEDLRSPVQVFDADGALIGAGYANRRPIWSNWQISGGDRVYGVRVDSESTEWEVVRYRLELDRR